MKKMSTLSKVILAIPLFSSGIAFSVLAFMTFSDDFGSPISYPFIERFFMFIIGICGILFAIFVVAPEVFKKAK
jgi:hypothetical protein